MENDPPSTPRTKELYPHVPEAAWGVPWAAIAVEHFDGRINPGMSADHVCATLFARWRKNRPDLLVPRFMEAVREMEARASAARVSAFRAALAEQPAEKAKRAERDAKREAKRLAQVRSERERAEAKAAREAAKLDRDMETALRRAERDARLAEALRLAAEKLELAKARREEALRLAAEKLELAKARQEERRAAREGIQRRRDETRARQAAKLGRDTATLRDAMKWRLFKSGLDAYLVDKAGDAPGFPLKDALAAEKFTQNFNVES